MCDSGTSQKRPRLFLRWPESGEPDVLIAEDASDLEHALGVLDELRELLAGPYEDGEQIVVYRRLMTDEDVAALPEL